MKYLKIFNIAVLAFTLSTLFGACSSDSNGNEDEDGSGSTLKNALIGTWKTSDSNDIYVFKANGRGIGCENADNIVAETWAFKYTYSKNSNTITMEDNGDTDRFTDVDIQDETMTLYDENEGKTRTLTKQVSPIPIIIANYESKNFDWRNDRPCLIYNKDGGSDNLIIEGLYLWHKQLNDNLRIDIIKDSDSDNMLNEYSYKDSKLTFMLNSNSSTSGRTATICVWGIDNNNYKVSSLYIDIYQEGIGNSLEVEGPSIVSGYGGNITFYVYNKDLQNITAHFPSGQTTKWERRTSVKYPGGQDWTFTAQVPANYTSANKTLEYKFVKNDGSSIIKKVTQDYVSGGGSGGGSSDIITGKVQATAHVIGPGLAYDREAQFIDGRTCTIDYTYYPSTGKYYVYGGPFCGSPSANGGKGLRFDAQKGYNSICIYHGVYFDYTYRTTIKYNWDVYLRFTLP